MIKHVATVERKNSHCFNQGETSGRPRLKEGPPSDVNGLGVIGKRREKKERLERQGQNKYGTRYRKPLQGFIFKKQCADEQQKQKNKIKSKPAEEKRSFCTFRLQHSHFVNPALIYLIAHSVIQLNFAHCADRQSMHECIWFRGVRVQKSDIMQYNSVSNNLSLCQN